MHYIYPKDHTKLSSNYITILLHTNTKDLRVALDEATSTEEEWKRALGVRAELVSTVREGQHEDDV